MSNANTIARIKDPIRTLRKIQTVLPDTIIAGGYHRDIFNNIPYSDVDIYVPTPDAASVVNNSSFCVHYTNDWEELLELKHDFRSMDRIQELTGENRASGVDGTPTLEMVFGMIKNEINYNLIIVNTLPIDFVMQTFDFNICKTYCDGEKVTFTKEFMSDVEQKRLTLTDNKLNLKEFTSAMNVHLPKLKYKYPQHKVVIPDVHDAVKQQYKENYSL
jgi:hypothetical protein